MLESEALLVSAAIEAPIAFLIIRAMRWQSRGAVHGGLAAAVATAVTHPQLWAAALWAYPRYGYWPSLVVLETIVVLVEGVLICWIVRLSLPRALLLSLVTNTASCAAGFLINTLSG
ncbi:MAG: hypothetical protein KGJ49_04640 [Alphaproteobacteria bacterium]|nr:hypothetical protein [Alphaproteobacteria bacterium]